MRKKTFLFLNLFFLSAYLLVAQSVDQQESVDQHTASIRISIADTSNNSLFLKHETLKEIWGLFRSDQLHEVRLRYQESDSEFWNSEYYDMNFEGDAYVFKNKYEGVIHYIEPKIDVQQIYGKEIKCLPRKRLRTIIRKDSVIFDFKLECGGEDQQRDVPFLTTLGVPAKYFGNLEKLSSTIEKQFAVITPVTDIDSILVFRGVVDVSGDLNNLMLEVGERSAFSDAVKNALNSSQGTQTLRERKRWVPARIERGPVKSDLRIYARLHEDGSVTISTTRLLGTLSVME